MNASMVDAGFVSGYTGPVTCESVIGIGVPETRRNESRALHQVSGFFVAQHGSLFGGPCGALARVRRSLVRYANPHGLPPSIGVDGGRFRDLPGAIMANISTTGISAHIAVIDGQTTTTTRDIAEVYGKRHDDVLRIVRQRMAEAPADWCLRNFAEASIEVPQPNGGTATYPVIRMTKKGFHFVVGKFTGAKAVQHQIAFADEFERMEAQIVSLHNSANSAPALPAPESTIDPRALLLTGQCAPVPMPPEVEAAISKQAWAMAHEAYELTRQHLARQVAYRHTRGDVVDTADALSDISSTTLGRALAHEYLRELGWALSSAESATRMAQNAAKKIRAQLAATREKA